MNILVIPNQIFPDTTIWRPEAIARTGRQIVSFWAPPPTPPFNVFFQLRFGVKIHQVAGFLLHRPLGWKKTLIFRWRKGGFPCGHFLLTLKFPRNDGSYISESEKKSRGGCIFFEAWWIFFDISFQEKMVFH